LKSFLSNLKKHQLISGLLLSLWLAVNVYVILATSSTKSWQIKEILAFILGNLLIFLALFYCHFFYQKAKEVPELSETILNQRFKRSLLLLGLLILILPFFFIIHVPDSAHNWDFFEVFNNTSYLHGRNFSYLPFTEDERLYFMRYPNNQLFGMFYNALFAPFGLTAKIWLSTALSAVLTSLSVIAGSFLTQAISNRKFAYLYNLLALVFLPFYLYGAELYTDTLSLPFVVLGLLFLIYAIKAEKLSRQITWSIASCLLVFLGYNIKPTVLIPFIAVLFYLLLKKQWKKLLLILTLAAILFFGIHTTVKVVISSDPTFSAKNNDRYNLPMMHWITMSFAPENKWGGFNRQVLEYSESFTSVKSKKAADLKLFIHNLKKQGVPGVLLQLWRKISYTWLNGDLSDFFYTYRHQNPLVFQLFDWTSFKPKEGNFTGWLLIKAAQTVFWIGIVFFMFYEIGRSIKRFFQKKVDIFFIPAISMLGLSVFLLIWEANSRYLYNFAPIMLMLAVSGLLHYLQKRKENSDELPQ
jgi:hypothetical protein